MLAVVCGIYLNDYYRGDIVAIQNFQTNNAVTEELDAQGNTVFLTEEADTGFIFYPGGKVEHTAYIPLMRALSSKGIFCVLVEMPFRLAVLDMDAAEGIQNQYPQIEHWYLGGHSLGGSMAAVMLTLECMVHRKATECQVLQMKSRFRLR